MIGSLWHVRDDTTKLAMLRRNREKYGDTRPATWGAFVLMGETE